MAKGGGKGRAKSVGSVDGGRSSGGGHGAPGSRRRSGPSATVADDFAASGSDSDGDARRLSLRDRDIAVGDYSDEDMGLGTEVLGLQADDSGDSEDELSDEGEEYDDDDDDVDAMIEKEIARGGRGAELAKQAKALGAKLKLQRGADDDDASDDDDDEDEEGSEGAEGAGADGWGANKRQYYNADTAELEGSDAEAAFAEEEEEAARLERARAAKLSAADFGLEEEEEDEDEDEEEEEEEESESEDGEPTMGARAKSKASQRGRGGVEVETVAKELGSLSAEQRDAALLADAPELLVLLQDLADSLSEVRSRIGPVLHEVRSGGLATSDGISYLEAKYLLLLQYCTHIVFYILLKAEGRPVKDHPVIARLVELRAYMEKIRPIDKRLQYQVERLIKAARIASKSDGGASRAGAAEAHEDDADALHFGPRRDQLVSKPGGGNAATAEGDALPQDTSGVYRPPKINPVSMEGDAENGKVSRNEARLLKEARRKAQRSEVVADLAADVMGAPREQRTELPGFDSLAAVKQRQKMEARAAAEEDMMARVPLSKEEAKKLKQQKRAGMSGKSMLDDFADEVADIVGMAQAGEGGGGKYSRLSELLSRQKVSQKFGADAPRLEARGGDEDVPRRAPLHERRLKYDAVAARNAAAAGGGDEDGGDDGMFFGGGSGRGAAGKSRAAGEEDAVYEQAKASAVERKRARSDKYSVPDTLPPLPDAAADGTRGITDAIERNRGLTPHRRKDLKNPRKKHRLAFAKAQVRRKGAVQEVRAPNAAYGGEATGVKSRIVKSRRLG